MAQNDKIVKLLTSIDKIGKVNMVLFVFLTFVAIMFTVIYSGYPATPILDAYGALGTGAVVVFLMVVLIRRWY